MSQVTIWYSSLSEEQKKMMKRGFWALLAVVALVATVIWKMSLAPGQAAPATGEAPAAAQPGNFASITGFRSAKFGADEDAVRDAIKADFGKSGDDVKVVESPVARTRSLAVRVKDLIPETGEAEIGYVLGYKSKALIQVNVLWGTPVTADTTGVSIAKTALLLRNYFSEQHYDPKTIIRDRKFNGGVLSFQASDAEGHLVRLLYREIPIGKPVKSEGDKKVEQKKAYTLTLSYVANPKAPDIFSIEKGAF
jgi:hypothetical protein